MGDRLHRQNYTCAHMYGNTKYRSYLLVWLCKCHLELHVIKTRGDKLTDCVALGKLDRRKIS